MLYYLFYPLRDIFFGFNIFRYITFRAAMAGVSSFLISVIVGPWLIRRLSVLKLGENIRKEEAPLIYNLHCQKQGTPTMGGILILLAVITSTILWSQLDNRYVLLCLFGIIYLGLLGLWDDFIKWKRFSTRGLSIRTKLLFQLLLGLVIGLILYKDPQFSTNLDLPFLKKLFIDLGIFFIPFVILVIAGSSNSVNLTDGLDGLAIGCIIIASLTYSVLSYVTGHIRFSEYLFIPYISGVGELSIVCLAIAGAGMGFLWFNCYPAGVFMGDCGALALGGAMGMVAVFIKKELLLLLVGGIFVAEALSVILQVVSFRLWGRRIFKIAPLHHHFQVMGWPESKVIVRFWIIAAILAILSLTTLKIR